jgi:hypothetical protein
MYVSVADSPGTRKALKEANEKRVKKARNG